MGKTLYLGLSVGLTLGRGEMRRAPPNRTPSLNHAYGGNSSTVSGRRCLSRLHSGLKWRQGEPRRNPGSWPAPGSLGVPAFRESQAALDS